MTYWGHRIRALIVKGVDPFLETQDVQIFTVI